MVWEHRPSNIGCKLHKLVDRHELTARSNSQCLHASPIARGYWLSDIVRDLLVSTTRHRSMASNICKGVHASAMAWAHGLGGILVIFHALKRLRWPITCRITNVLTHITWFLRIKQAILDKCMYNFQRNACITRGVYGSSQWHQCRPMKRTKREGLHITNMACAHLASKVLQWNATSSRSCMCSSWCVWIGWETFELSSSVRQGFCSSVKRHWKTGEISSRHGHMSHDVCTSAGRHQWWPTEGKISQA